MRAPAVLSALAFAIPCLLAARPASGNSDPGSPIKVWVHLVDKGPAGSASSVGYHPRPSSRAWEDAPIHAPYLEALAAAGLVVDTRLKWQNLVSGRIDPARLPRLRALPFVTSVAPLPRRTVRPRGLERAPWIPSILAKQAAPSTPNRSSGPAQTLEDLGAFQALADTLGITPVLRWLETTGRKPGQGIRVAVMDADFDLGHMAFNRLRQEGRIKDEWDFVDGDAQAVSAGFSDSHGAQCLSLIGGYLPGILVGAAPEAEFLLYRTENSDAEAYVEEDYLAAAIERAVDSGAKVISISVVYRTRFDTQPDIPLAEVDGRTRPSTLAALGAARRDVLVVTAMGNMDGNQSGPSTLSVPSDADSILAVGIVSRGRVLCGYSTTGPTADGRVKPDLVSMGTSDGCRVPVAAATTTAPDQVLHFQGTSFAAPVVAGIAALLRQALPEQDAQAIRRSLLETASNAAAPNSTIGWGLPNASAALNQQPTAIRPVATRPRPSGAAVFHDAAGRRLPSVPGAAGMRFPGARAVPDR